MRWLIAMLAVFHACTLKAQHGPGIVVGYQYLQCQNWDAAVNAWNFNRPWLSSNLPQLSHGYFVGLHHRIGLGENFALLPELRSSRFSSTHDVSDGFSIQAYIVEARIGVQYYYLKAEGSSEGPASRAFLEMNAGGSWIATRFSNEADSDDDDPAWVFGSGMHITGYLGYDIAVGEKLMLTPLLGSGWAPRMGASGFETTVGDSDGVIGDFGQAFTYEVGLRVALKR